MSSPTASVHGESWRLSQPSSSEPRCRYSLPVRCVLGRGKRRSSDRGKRCPSKTAHEVWSCAVFEGQRLPRSEERRFPRPNTQRTGKLYLQRGSDEEGWESLQLSPWTLAVGDDIFYLDHFDG